jgi:CheY-like chemotaxis protein
MKILVADDDPICRLHLESCLRKGEYDVVACGNGEEAWHQIESGEEPLLAILDWHMPGLGGLELCRRARELPAGRMVYVILLTGSSGRESVLRGLGAGAHDYIVKPFDTEELYARLLVGKRVLHLQQTLADRVRQLEDALLRVRQLYGLLPGCCYCKSIRTDQDYWQQLEHYIAAHSDVRFSHAICPSCSASVVQPQIEAIRPAVTSRDGLPRRQ